MKKMKIYHLLLGIGLGIIITSSVNVAFNKTEIIEYTDAEIKEKAEALGMISIKENIEKNDEEVEKVEKKEPQIEIKTITVDREDGASDVIDQLRLKGVIDSAEEFRKVVVEHNLQKKFRTGVYKIKQNSSYDEVLRKLVKEEELKKVGLL